MRAEALSSKIVRLARFFRAVPRFPISWEADLSLYNGLTAPARSDGLLREGGRPPDGDIDGSAHAVCPACDYDHHALVRVRKDVITDVVPDYRAFPYAPDAVFAHPLALACGRCEREGDMEVALFAGHARPSRRIGLGDRYEPRGRLDPSSSRLTPARSE